MLATTSSRHSTSALAGTARCTCTCTGTMHRTYHRTRHRTRHLATLSTIFVKATLSRRKVTGHGELRRIPEIESGGKKWQLVAARTPSRNNSRRSRFFLSTEWGKAQSTLSGHPAGVGVRRRPAGHGRLVIDATARGRYALQLFLQSRSGVFASQIRPGAANEFACRTEAARRRCGPPSGVPWR